MIKLLLVNRHNCCWSTVRTVAGQQFDSGDTLRLQRESVVKMYSFMKPLLRHWLTAMFICDMCVSGSSASHLAVAGQL